MSGSLGVVAFEGELNAIVKEYLSFVGFERTRISFDRECLEHGKPVNTVDERLHGNAQLIEVQRELRECFREGRRDDYFRMWYSHLPSNICDNDMVASKLEFYLYLYFTIYPIKHKDESSRQESLDVFQQYLHTKGSVLSQTTEFLPFYALPYVPDPSNHPSYKELFQNNWASDLEVRLDKFLTLALKSTAQPRLFQLYKGTQLSMSNEAGELHMKLLDSERRATSYMKRHQKVNTDYHNLIGITADLIDALESTIQGKTVTPEQVQSLCVQLFTNHMKQSMDLRRPGTAGDVLRASVMPQDDTKVATYCQLDFPKLMSDLNTSSDSDRGLLLQALRWRLTRASTGEQRDAVLSDYIKADLMGCMNNENNRRVMARCLSSDSIVVKQYTARLLNAVASLCIGRGYMSQNAIIVQQLMANLHSGVDEDNITFENILGCLQKLSLRRVQQSVMIEEGVIEWLVGVLRDSDALTDYTLEYSVALLMNLCLRTDGKKRCVRVARETLKILSDLLGHDYHEIRPYVNGTLYSILAIPSIREQARAMGMEEILRCFTKDEKADMNRQIEFIIKQLKSNDAPEDADSDDEDDEDEDEDDQDGMEVDLDKDEVLSPQDGGLSGESLLGSRYAISSVRDEGRKKRHTTDNPRNTPLQRPVTPSQMRADVLTIPLNSNLDAVTEIDQRNSPAHTPPPHRPPTRTGSRSSSHPTTPSSNRPPTGSDSKTSTSKKKLEVTPRGNKDDPYQAAFGSRPRIPRTPDLGNTPPPPPPTYSDSEPRPSSAGKSSNSGSPRKSVSARSGSKPTTPAK